MVHVKTELHKPKWKTSGYCQCWMNNWKFILSSFFCLLFNCLLKFLPTFDFFYKHLFVIYSSWIYVNHHNYKSVYFYRILNSIIVLHQISSNFLTGGISWWADPRTSIILVSKNVICLISHSDIWLIDRRMLMLSRKALLTVFTFLSENLLISIIIVIRHSLTGTWMYIVI